MQKVRKEKNRRKALNAKADRFEAKLKTWNPNGAASKALANKIEDLRAGKDISSLAPLSAAIRDAARRLRK